MDDEQSVERVVADLCAPRGDRQNALICVAGFEDVPALDYRADDEQCDGLAGARVGKSSWLPCVFEVARAYVGVALIEQTLRIWKRASAFWLLRVFDAKAEPGGGTAPFEQGCNLCKVRDALALILTHAASKISRFENRH